MKRILTLLMMGLPALLCAAERSSKEAAVLAAQFMNEQYAQTPQRRTSCSASSFILAHTRAKFNSEAPAFYVFNKSNHDGYIVVSADDRTQDVLMYSDAGALDVDNANPNVRFWLDRLQEEISFVNDSNRVSNVLKKATMTSAIGPLLKNEDGVEIGWYQEAPYNNLCPMDERDNTRCLTGCVATAAAQIMYSWRYPDKGVGKHSYTWYDWMDDSGYDYKTKTLSQDFSKVTFDWDNILPSYYGKNATTAQKSAVATLMYCCGIACDMQYGGDATGGSGAFTDDMAFGLKSYFGYEINKMISAYSRSTYSEAKGSKIANVPCEWQVSVADFTDYFNSDLEAGRPILMGGEDMSGGGHEFVCDGRDTRGYFHINWGWEGESNCYCQLSSLKPSGTSYNFRNNIDALIGLQPGEIDTIHVTGVTVSPKSATLKINEKITISATVSPANATVSSVNWTSSNPNVASVSESGVVHAVGQGKTIIKATSVDCNKSASATITVTDQVAPSGVFFLVDENRDLKDGDEVILVATYNSVHYVAATGLQKINKNSSLGSDIVSIRDKSVTLEDETDAAIFRLNKSASNWVLTEITNNDTLSASAVKKIVWNGMANQWSIDVNNDVATIANANKSYGRILFHGINMVFSNYGATTSTSDDLLLPQLFVRNLSGTDTIVPVQSVSLGQTSARMEPEEQIQLYHSIHPAYATNQGVTWQSSNTNVATVNYKGVVSSVAVGKTIISVTTLDGNYLATCVVTVADKDDVPQDTIYATPSQARSIASALKPGESSEDFYGVQGFVTVPNVDTYSGFWMADKEGSDQVFQGFNCQMPPGYIVLSKGQYVCVYGYLMNYDNQKMQIKDGEVILLDAPMEIMDIWDERNRSVSKFIQNGQLYIVYGAKLYNAQGYLIH